VSDPEKDVVYGYRRGFDLGYISSHSLEGQSPAYVHGFRNGVADANNRVNQRAPVARARWAMIAGSHESDAKK